MHDEQNLPTRRLKTPWPFPLSVAPARKGGKPRLVRNLQPPEKRRRQKPLPAPDKWKQVALL